MNRNDLKTFLVAGIIAVVIVLGATFAHAAEAPQKPPARWSCWAVRKAVSVYGSSDVESMARAAGISDEEIQRAKRCLK